MVYRSSSCCANDSGEATRHAPLMRDLCDSLGVSIAQILRRSASAEALRASCAHGSLFGSVGLLWRAHFRLYRRRFLQRNARWKALDEIYKIYKIYILSHRSDLKISAKNRQHFLANE